MAAEVLRNSNLASAVLAFLPVCDLEKSLHTCKHFKACAFEAFKVQARFQKEISLEQLWAYRIFMIERLGKKDASYTEILDRMIQVKSVTINSVDAPHFAFLEGALEEMLLSKAMSSLTSLSITTVVADHSVTNHDLQDIVKTCGKLRRLEIHRFESEKAPQIHLLSDEGMKELPCLDQLQSISIHNAPAITHKTLEIFAQMPALTFVRLSKCTITKQDVISFCAMTADRHVTFDDTVVTVPDLI
ncbi:MAG: hypothetical protein ACHQT8_01020 [Chlamydiales bacterium]